MSETTQSPPILHQFMGSHFNEKARWGLDWKRVPHRRVSYLPGPHMRPIRKLTGQTSVPVLELDGEIIAGSAAILARVEEGFPDAPLFPTDPELRARALEIQSGFDAEVGPAVRTALFSVLVREPDHLCAIFSRHRGTLGRAAYRATFPIAKRLMSRAHGTDDPDNVARAFEIARGALDRVAKQIGPSGQLVGEAFSVADLTCAALLAPLVRLEHPDMKRPEPVPAAVESFLARWADHETVGWVREQYARHRPAPAAIEGAR